jgi:hypothetical protein
MDGVVSEMENVNIDAQVNLEPKHQAWINSLHRISELTPDGTLVGGAALTVQLLAKKPELAISSLSSDGPHDLDVVCPQSRFAELKQKYNMLPFATESQTKDGYLRKKGQMPDSFYLSFFDLKSVTGKSLHIEVILEGQGPQIKKEDVEINGKRIKVATPEELMLQRMLQLVGYERQGNEKVINEPQPHHFEYFRLNRQIIDEVKMDELFPLYKERMKTQRKIDIKENSWQELETKIKQVIAGQLEPKKSI